MGSIDQNSKNSKTKKTNRSIIVLVVVAIIAIGGLSAFTFSYIMGKEKNNISKNSEASKDESKDNKDPISYEYSSDEYNIAFTNSSAGVQPKIKKADQENPGSIKGTQDTLIFGDVAVTITSSDYQLIYPTDIFSVLVGSKKYQNNNRQYYYGLKSDQLANDLDDFTIIKTQTGQAIFGLGQNFDHKTPFSLININDSKYAVVCITPSEENGQPHKSRSDQVKSVKEFTSGFTELKTIN